MRFHRGVHIAINKNPERESPPPPCILSNASLSSTPPSSDVCAALGSQTSRSARPYSIHLPNHNDSFHGYFWENVHRVRVCTNALVECMTPYMSLPNSTFVLWASALRASDTSAMKTPSATEVTQSAWQWRLPEFIDSDGIISCVDEAHFLG